MGRQALAAACSILAILAVAGPAAAHPGDLDPTFSGDGKQTAGFGQTDLASSLLLVPGGKLLVGGQTGPSDIGPFDFALARFDAAGELDGGFSGDGRQTTDFGGSDTLNALAPAPDDKLVAVGTIAEAGFTDGDIAVARYHADGSPDEDFSGDGKQIVDAIARLSGDAVVALPDGKVMIAGAAGGNFLLVRLNEDGSPDTSFSGDGRLTTDLGGDEFAGALLRQPDGKLVVAGTSVRSADDADFAVARYEPDGDLDAGFSGDGKVLTDFQGESFDRGFAATLAPAGKLIVAGGFGRGADQSMAAARYGPGGALDTSFDLDGKVEVNFDGPAALARDVKVLPDGDLVLAGLLYDGSSFGPATNFAVARVNADGRVDFDFAGDGRANTDFDDGSDFGNALAVQPDGNLVLAGHSGSGFAEDAAYDFALARYHGGDESPPVAYFVSGPEGFTPDPTPTFEFSALEYGATFECRADGGGFSACSSPLTTAPLADGPHFVEVRGIDQAGNADQTPARRDFTVATGGSAGTGPAGGGGPGAGGIPSGSGSLDTGGLDAGGAGSVTVFALSRFKAKRDGTGRLTVVVPGAGSVVVKDAAKKHKPLVKTVRKTVASAGKVTLRIVLTKAGRKALARAAHHRRRFSVKVVFTASRGGRATRLKQLTLARKP